MKDDDVLPVSTPTAHMSFTPATSSSSKKETNLFKSSLFGRGRYKFWALAAILLLAFCSMLAGTVTLRLSTDKFNRFIDDIGTPVHDDLDVLVSFTFLLVYLCFVTTVLGRENNCYAHFVYLKVYNNYWHFFLVEIYVFLCI